MKKNLLAIILLSGLSAVAAAQPRAVGLRGGWGVEASYQHSIGSDFIEADLGLNGTVFNLAATYNWMLAQPQWTDRGDWGIYAGAGAAVGATLCATGQIGLEYTFWFPLQLSFDLRPQIGIHLFNQTGIYYGGWVPTLAARYRF